MPKEAMLAAPRTCFVVNPNARSGEPSALQDAVRRYLPDHADSICEVGGNIDPGDLAARAVREGYDLVVAAGGDGTVAAVAKALIGSDVRLGIIPLGTSNVLARELGIPLDLDQASQLLLGPHEIVPVDAMKVGDQYFFTQIGIGVNSLAIQGARHEDKRRFGRLAYVWAGVVRLFGYQPRRFTIVADDKRLRPRATQVMVANSAAVGTFGMTWGEHVRYDDGQIDVCVMRGLTVLDYAGMWGSFLLRRQHRDRRIHYLQAKRSVVVDSDVPLPIQADGEIIGNTPLKVEVVPRALRVVVPSRATEG